MAGINKLNRVSDQRRAILRNQVTALIWNGKIVTTNARAKEVRRIAEKLITKAIRQYDNTVTVTKSVKDSNGNIEITGELHIFGESFCFKGNGKISFHAIHISIPHEDFTYELDGTVKR